MRLKIAMPVIAATAALIAGGATAAPASAAPAAPTASHQAKSTCQTWTDGVTAGVSCNTSRKYYAWAKCKNGSTVYGARKNNRKWSYAYCSSVASSVRTYGYAWV
ncbi:hypothetical protein AB0B21_32740 [Streptomyces rimosus]|uniref:hypothetical protein n=1 Tax=Streptomyces rimosus TaxID=1927 RepID=UPI000D168FD1|nr:hypothetical protein [Streptomyces rimosus]